MSVLQKQNLMREIKRIIKEIVTKYKPERIILFGSAAQGNLSEDSDVDFLIIKRETPTIGRDRARELRRLIKKNLPTDFLIYRPEEFEERIRLGDPFVLAILKEGKVVYGR
ncbi:MAG: nucleotidyltransferase domain-containing protein [Candidatus Edwardsbacteria bacterium]